MELVVEAAQFAPCRGLGYPLCTFGAKILKLARIDTPPGAI
jgi:hypothetical protein